MDRTDASLIALRRILRVTELYARDLAASAGLTPAQLRVLQIVNEKASVMPKELAAQMGVAQATITALVDKLVNAKLVERHTSQTDRRQINVTLTEAGRKILANAPDALQQKFVRQFESLENWEQAMLVAALERVSAMLDAQSIDAAPILTIGDLHMGRKRDELSMRQPD